MLGKVLEMVLMMIIPTGVLIYTISFGRWMKKKRLASGFVSALFVGIISYVTTGWVLWRLIT